jgi:hypothetical protein
MKQSPTQTVSSFCDARSKRLHYPVDAVLLKQRKCRTQALKQLLSIPEAPAGKAPRTWRLACIISDFLYRLQIRPSYEAPRQK